jgi:hypothetical protein
MEDLREQMYSLNMRLRLTLMTNDEETRLSLERQLQDVQKQMEDMMSGVNRG